MQYVSIAVVTALLLLLLMSGVASAQGGPYTAEQQNVIRLIYEACDRWRVDCTIPLAVARRESGFGSNRQGDWSEVKGRYQSAGIFQWHENGQGANGEYFWRYGLAWRWNEDLDIDRGVQMTTSHLRGGFDYLNCTCGWWTPTGLNTWNLPARPGFVGGGGPLPVTPSVRVEATPEPLPTLRPCQSARLEAE